LFVPFVRTGNPITRIVKLLVLVNSAPTFAEVEIELIAEVA